MQVLKVTKRSLRQFQFGDGEHVITLDVIEIADQWHEINFALRVLENDMWVLPPSKVNEFAVNRLNFVQGIVNDAYKELEAPTLSRIEAEEFIRMVMEETEKLRNFTSRTKDEISSAPESTAEAPGVNFSQ